MTDAEFVATIVAAYTLTEEHMTHLAGAIQKSRLALMQASYRVGQYTVGLKPNWTPTRRALHRIEQRSQQDAQGIAETYRIVLQSFVEMVLEKKKLLTGLHSASWNDLFGTLAEAARALITNVAQWLVDFLSWKSDQITNYSCGSGTSDGTTQFVEDVLAAQDGDGIVTGDNGETVIDLSLIQSVDAIGVAIVPGTSSSDFCRDYAGHTYAMEDFLSLGVQFPAHPFCRHTSMIVNLAQ